MIARLVRGAAFYALVARHRHRRGLPVLLRYLTSLKYGNRPIRGRLLAKGTVVRRLLSSVLTTGTFLRNIGNSLLVATVVVALSLLLGVTAAYPLSRIHFRGRRLLLLTILSVSMFPQIAVLAGLFELIRALGIYNTPLALIFAYMIFTLPFTVWVLTTFMAICRSRSRKRRSSTAPRPGSLSRKSSCR